ncbi:3-methyl-2-oxobutanoate hydroxymethyltransferase [Sedimentibacter sp.]|uniref:3-methyl-2-oxobutanoate hydroxymethyltransferase n=1 Tax=Sedimentibacter sp. TaxID=1960295 RepID=UPI0028A68824|nr:3-methyl-2-oxobutanoate hydroxymethyltransferase [Sedimentibacter sp.]
MKTKFTVTDFKKYKKEGKKFSFVTAYDYTMASIINESNCEIILVGDSLGMVMLGYTSTTSVTMDDIIHHTKPVVKGAPDTFVISDMPFGSYNTSVEKAVENANRLIKETGCDCVKLEGGEEIIDTIKAIINGGTAVVGHIGLTPQRATQLGGFKVQGSTPESAKNLIETAVLLEKAGVIAIVLECVPSVVAKRITESVSIPVLGIGAGKYVDCQVLVTQDLLGMYNDFKPKFVKRFAQIRNEMIKGLNQFHDETLNGEFPTPEYSFNKEVELDRLY